ncbi:methylated-DNA--[protein]-cysteine S-methyltransferase, partial [Rhizobium ruizarguesonis]
MRYLDLYFAGKEPHFMPALSPSGTTFQQAVWEILRTIPYGQTTTYGAIA